MGWLGRWRARRRARGPYGDCPGCGHDWRSHPGGPHADPEVGACDECGYEIGHGERADPPCRRPAAPRPGEAT